MLAEDVAQKRFQPTRWREGYDQGEVDAFLDRVQAALAADGQGPAGELLTPEDVVAVRFQPTRFRPGYDQDEVDDYLDEIVQALQARRTR